MVRKIFWMSATVFSMSVGVFAGTASEVQTKDLAPVRVFAVTGFDDNDNIQVVAQIPYPNSCYQVAPAIVKVDRLQKIVRIQTPATFLSNGVCAFGGVSYHPSVIELGRLPEGDYDVRTVVNGTEKTVQKLSVVKATVEETDSFLYAPIDEISVEPSADKESVTVTVSGKFSNDCMGLKEIQVPKQASQDVTVVLPIAELLALPECHQRPTPFKGSVTITPAKSGFNLVHVRSENGFGFNRVYSFVKP